MNKLFSILVLCFLISIVIGYAAVLEVGVSEVLDGNVTYLNYDSSSNIVKFSIEFYNTGSVPFKARIKTDIFDDEELLFTGWSQERDFMPGHRDFYSIYWYANNVDTYSAKMKVYFGDETKDYKKFDFSVKEIVPSEDVFEVQNLRTYDNYIIFDLKSKRDAENVVIIPDQYTKGWMFEQRMIGNMSENSTKMIVLDYEPTLWVPSNISLIVASNAGKYYTEETVEIKKIKGLTGFLYYFWDNLRMAFFK